MIFLIFYFRCLWDEIQRNQDVAGPYTLLEKLVRHPVSFLNRLLGRRSTRFLTEARLCNYTFYPPLLAAEGEAREITLKAWRDFVAHCWWVIMICFIISWTSFSSVFVSRVESGIRQLSLISWFMVTLPSFSTVISFSVLPPLTLMFLLPKISPRISPGVTVYAAVIRITLQLDSTFSWLQEFRTGIMVPVMLIHQPGTSLVSFSLPRL